MKLPQMAKYDKKNKSFREFDQTVREILGVGGESEHEDSFDEDIECEISSIASDSLEDEMLVEDSSSSCTVGEIHGSTLDISGGCRGRLDDSEDFPAGNSDSEMSITADQIRRLEIADRKVHKNLEHIINPDKRKKSEKRCKNFDD